METIPRRIVPMLREGGATDEDLHRMLVENPRRLLAPATPAAGVAAVPGAVDNHHEGSGT